MKILKRGPQTKTRIQIDLTKPYRFWERLKEIDLFFQKNDAVYMSMRRLVRRLEKAKIAYAVMGGMAVNAHHYQRTTRDVDVLLTSEGLDAFRRLFVPKKYQAVVGRDRRFLDRINKVKLDILETGSYPGTGKPGPIAFPNPENVSQTIEKCRFVDLTTLVQLKLAARRHRDFADVVELIRFNNLDEAFLHNLHPTVRRDFIECLEEKRREDEYETREG